MLKPLAVISILGVSFFVIQHLYLFSKESTASSQEGSFQEPKTAATSKLPVHLIIPKIKVDSSLDYVGLTSEGAVDIPKEPAKAAWFETGVRPGENGTAVIVGHFGWKNNIPAIFDNLHKLEKGDKIYVEDETGTTITFIVRELRKYSAEQIVPDVFTSDDGKSHLNLITCEGVWDKTKKSYSKRLVVFSDKEM